MLVPAGIPVNFTAVFPDADPALIAMSVYDDTGEDPVLLLSPVLMAPVVGTVFRGKFTPASGKLYLVVMAVYTTDTFVTLDTDYDQQSAAVVAQYLTPPVQSVVGAVQCEGGN